MSNEGRYRARAALVDSFVWDGIDLNGLARWATETDIAGKMRRGEEIPRNVSHPIDAVSLGRGRWRLEVRTSDGTLKAAPGDFVVCTQDGSFHVCKPSLFTALFEPSPKEIS